MFSRHFDWNFGTWKFGTGTNSLQFAVRPPHPALPEEADRYCSLGTSICQSHFSARTPSRRSVKRLEPVARPRVPGERTSAVAKTLPTSPRLRRTGRRTRRRPAAANPPCLVRQSRPLSHRPFTICPIDFLPKLRRWRVTTGAQHIAIRREDRGVSCPHLPLSFPHLPPIFPHQGRLRERENGVWARLAGSIQAGLLSPLSPFYSPLLYPSILSVHSGGVPTSRNAA